MANLRTKLNIAPFTFTGDGNDAIFPLLNEVMHHPCLLASLRKYFYLKIEPNELPMKRKWRRIQRKPPKVEDEVVVRLNHSKRKKEKEYQRSKFSWKPPKGTSKYKESAKLELQSKFAEQVRKNIEQFEQFCEEYQCVTLSTRKENPRAIFGPSAFPPVMNEPPKRIARDPVETLPLKFPWNDVFDTEIRVVKRRNPLILFSFENQSIQRH